jgi:hypothetical protein
MADKPILFSAPMIRALLDGRKTQTRRMLKIDGAFAGHAPTNRVVDYYGDGRLGMAFERPGYSDLILPLSYAPGDRLWVREAFMPAPMEAPPISARPTLWNIAYGAGGQAEIMAPSHYNPTLYNYERWSPSIHMPRWASRMTLVVTEVRVQRLQEISEADAMAEGVEAITLEDVPRQAARSRRADFAALWDNIYGPAAWGPNPWVCALTFTVHRCNIDQMPGAA